MSLYTVARDDFRNARRSYVVLGVIGVLAGLIALIFVSEIDIYDYPYRTLFDVTAFVAFVVPLFLAPLAYLSIAGDRGDGTIKYVMGLPNTRLEYFLGKYLSRAGVAVVAVLASVAVGFVIALAAFERTPAVTRFGAFAVLSLAYVASFTAVYVALSALTKSRSRAMFGAIGLYFLFVPFWFGFLPVINLTTIIDAVADVLGVTIAEETRRRIATLSPATAYLEATELVYADVPKEYPAFEQFTGDDKLVGTTWFNVVLMLGWTGLALVLGYVRFLVSELG